MLAGAAVAALMGLCAPVSAATSPELAPAILTNPGTPNPAVDAFYASRRAAPLGLGAGADSSAARELIGVLQRAPLDGLSSGPALAAEAQALMARASAGDRAAQMSADRMLSAAWVAYVQALQT